MPPPPPKPFFWPSAVAFVALLIAVLHLLLFQLEPGAPMWAVPAGTLPEQIALARMQPLDAQFRSAAAGKNLELKLIGFDPNDDRQQVMIGALYYRANYVLYPQRAWVGADNHVINTGSDIIAADTVPPGSWMRAHDVSNIEGIISSEGAPLRTIVRPVR